MAEAIASSASISSVWSSAGVGNSSVGGLSVAGKISLLSFKSSSVGSVLSLIFLRFSTGVGSGPGFDGYGILVAAAMASSAESITGAGVSGAVSSNAAN